MKIKSSLGGATAKKKKNEKQGGKAEGFVIQRERFSLQYADKMLKQTGLRKYIYHGKRSEVMPRGN